MQQTLVYVCKQRTFFQPPASILHNKQEDKTMRKISLLLVTAIVVSLCIAPAATAEDYAPIAMNEKQAAAANLFLSNFTEVGIEACAAAYDDKSKVDFAHDHMWFNDHEAYEYGEYANENNCRVSDDRIQEIIDAYFYDSTEVDLSQTRFDYVDGYYYHCETGGWSNDGFAHVINICPIGENKYFVSFYIFGGGDKWENDVMDDTLAEIVENYHQPNGFGSALIYAEDLEDRSTYRMISYSRV